MKGWLYCADFPEGEVMEGKAYEVAKASGWVDTPELIGSEIEPPKNKGGRPRKVQA